MWYIWLPEAGRRTGLGCEDPAVGLASPLPDGEAAAFGFGSFFAAATFTCITA